LLHGVAFGHESASCKPLWRHFLPCAHLVEELVVAGNARVGIGGIVGTALIEKYTGAELGFLYIIFGIVTSSLALAFGNRLINMLRFRKLQRAYRNPDYQENLIQSEVYKKIYEQVQSEYDRSHN
jgi:hypothetical protein